MSFASIERKLVDSYLEKLQSYWKDDREFVDTYWEKMRFGYVNNWKVSRASYLTLPDLYPKLPTFRPAIHSHLTKNSLEHFCLRIIQDQLFKEFFNSDDLPFKNVEDFKTI